MKKPLSERGRSPSRTLESLERDYLQFSTKGEGNIKNAKHYNNVIASSIFNIPLSQVHVHVGIHIHVHVQYTYKLTIMVSMH